VNPVVAAFDVDGTLTVRDCVFPFLLRVGRGRFLARLAVRLPAIIRLAATRDRNGLKELFVSAGLGGRDVESVDSLGNEFAATVASGWMRPDVSRRLRWHQDEGHVVVLVSASLSPYLLPLGELLEVDAVLCTELEQESGVYTGALRGRNCRGDEKVNRLREWAAEAGLPGDDWLQYAYGDSAGDAALLQAAANGTNVSRTEVPA
jgi:phosphatidylglycerophosphatase C